MNATALPKYHIDKLSKENDLVNSSYDKYCKQPNSSFVGRLYCGNKITEKKLE